jgi:TQXA domain-containing protein
VGHFVFVRRGWRVAVLLGLALGVFLVQVAPAGADAVNGSHPPKPKAQLNTDLYWNGQLGPGQYSVSGYLPSVGVPFDPLTGYPPSNPTSGFDPVTEYFAGVIHGQPTDGSAVVPLYCIDIRTETRPNFGYGLGTWDDANVPNVGYVARILNEYYPTVPTEPAGLTDNDKAAAVQAAIWFFTDGFVVSESNLTLRNAVVGIVDHVLSLPPLVEPPPPSLTVTPTQTSGPAGRPIGPFTVATDAPDGADVTATGGTMYSNRLGTTLLGNGTTATGVKSGQQIWLRSAGGSSTATLQATSKATVPSGNVYLYDGKTAGYTEAQKLILAKDATLTTTVRATGEFKPSGSLRVTKTIAGPAAGSQGPVVIQVACNEGRRFKPITIPAGTPAGSKSRTYHHILAGTVCTVTETANGSVVGTDVVVTGDGQKVTIPSDGTATVNITNTYDTAVSPGPPTTGSLIVTKTISGPLAGDQGPVTIQAVCNGTSLSPVTVAGGTKASSVSQSFNDIPGGSVCTVTETADGSTDTVTATVSGSGQQVTVPAGKATPVEVTDVYQAAPGSLVVTKKFAGSAARQHGQIGIVVDCGGPDDVFAFVIPAHTAGPVSRAFTGIPGGSRCTVTEAAIGSTARVSAVAIGRRQTVTIPAGGTATVHITDKFSVKAIAVTRPPAVTG